METIGASSPQKFFALFSSEKELELPESESASVNPSKSQSALEPLSSSSSAKKFCPEPRHEGYMRAERLM
ncbi:hypothetical protein JZ751_027987 [Albula glossodonta]|uniref:Uncharacterized protein n=1 Tax=Albula glossodonta TaxID=121402 RepID=A0A8T2PIT2_9TELE|nr:hypothetical protein JZ751_027987 [Albula glossodonta]